MSKPPGFHEGLNAIEEWLDRVYPEDVFGDGGLDLEHILKVNPGLRTVRMFRWVLKHSVRDLDIPPAIFTAVQEDE